MIHRIDRHCEPCRLDGPLLTTAVRLGIVANAEDCGCMFVRQRQDRAATDKTSLRCNGCTNGTAQHGDKIETRSECKRLLCVEAMHGENAREDCRRLGGAIGVLCALEERQASLRRQVWGNCSQCCTVTVRFVKRAVGRSNGTACNMGRYGADPFAIAATKWPWYVCSSTCCP